MRDHVRAFVESAAVELPTPGPVYEFGSYLVAGQERLANLRPLFESRTFIGCDMRPGPGVDRIEDLGRLSLADGAAGTIVCVDTLEHVFEARRAVEEMIRVLAPGGALILAAPMDFRIHAHPDDYWRFTPSCFARLLATLPAIVVGSQGMESYPHTVYAVGCKESGDRRFAAAVPRLIERFEARLEELAKADPRQRPFRQALLRWTRGKGERRREAEAYRTRFTFFATPTIAAYDPSGESWPLGVADKGTQSTAR